MKAVVNVIVVDDHPVVLQGFAYMLQEMPGIKLVGKYADAESALLALESETIDIVLLDINLPEKNGIDVCAEIKAKRPLCKVIAISNINEHSIIQRMLQAGASGYLLKNASAEEVQAAIHTVVDGGTGLSKSVEVIMSSLLAGDVPVITKREKEILQLLARGLSSTEIGEKVFISPLTVESHRRNLLQKFKVANVAALIHRAMEMKYIA